MNEIKNVVNGNADLIGDLSQLNTDNKDNIVGAINEINNFVTEGQKILWEGAWDMDASKTANLSEKISEQKTGIVLVWSAYSGGKEQNYDWFTYYIPKHFLNLHTGQGFDINMHTPTFGHVGGKYVYINDNSIVGHANNTASGSNNGVTYANNYWVLRYVIGV